VEKHQRHLAPLLKILGPSSRDNPRGLGVLVAAPYFVQSRRRRGKHKRPTTKPPFMPRELVALDAACDIARKPWLDGISAATWWRCFIRVVYNTTWRVETTLDLRFSWIKDGWVTIPAEHVKLGEADEQPQRFPFNAHAQAAIELLRVPGRDLVFTYRDGPAPKVKRNGWLGVSRRHLDEHFREIKQAAGIDPADGRMYHAIRRSAALAYERLGRGVGSYMCGHTGQQVTDQHYVGDGLAIDYAARLEQPQWSTEPST
jgi:integrase